MPGHVHVFGTRAISACSDCADVLGEVSSESATPGKAAPGTPISWEGLPGVLQWIVSKPGMWVGYCRSTPGGVISGAVGPKGPGYAGGVDRTRWRRPGRHRVDTVDGSDDC